MLHVQEWCECPVYVVQLTLHHLAIHWKRSLSFLSYDLLGTRNFNHICTGERADSHHLGLAQCRLHGRPLAMCAVLRVSYVCVFI